jgi:hypothetical protein
MNRTSVLLALALSVLFLRDVGAVTTRSFITSSYKDFDEGEAEHALVTSLGEIMPGTMTERVDLETDAAWSAVHGPDGTIYVGGVTSGAIYAIQGNQHKVLASLSKETPWIGALALAPDGHTLYAGTLATATLFAIDTKSGAQTKVAALPETEHIWALILDAGQKTLYAATGPQGKLYSVLLPSGKVTVLWDSEEKHVLSLAQAQDGALWLGSAEGAIVYRFDLKSGQARAIADFAGTEVKAIVPVEGGVVVAVNDFPQTSTTAPAAPTAQKKKGTTPKAPDVGTKPGSKPKPEQEEEAPRSGERKGKGALFRVEPDGRVEQLHALTEGYFQALAEKQGSVYAASAMQGRVYEIRADRTVVTAFDVSERQVNAIVSTPSGLAFVTGDGGAVYQTKGPAKDATYVSKVLDAQFPARWGNLRWRGKGPLTVSTRSGNTAKPDRGWSAWQALGQATPAGSDATLGRIASPVGRYLQYRVTFESAPSGLVREATVYYVPQNQRTRVTEISVGDAGDPTKKPPITLTSGVTKPRSPILKLRWKVENPDDDELVYTVEYRSEDEAEWRALVTGDPLTKPEVDFNTEVLPDGHYRLRVTASDLRANPSELALTDSLISAPFLVDNLKPQIVGLKASYPFVSGRAEDSFSRIDEIAYSLDGIEWMVAHPKDGLFDDRAELFTLKLPPDLKPGTYTLTVRVADEADNIGATTLTLRIGK